MSAVTIQDISKRFGTIEVMKNISVSIDDGEFVVLVGPSGCGKSTLLRMIAGLEKISDGTIVIGSRVVNDLPPKARDIAMVFQNYALYPHMSVSENMSFSLKLKKASASEIKQRVGGASHILGLQQLLARFPRQLSGGQRQRVAMGRAIVRDPQLFLFDEPLSNLDAKLRVQMRAEIKELHQRLKTTTIYVTHDQIEAMTMADKIVVLKDGLVEQMGPPLELYDFPANKFVAGFIGSPSMNFIDGVVRNHGTPVVETVTGDHVSLDALDNSVQEGQRVTCGVRPEHLQVVSTDSTAPDLKGTVQVVEPTGSETMIRSRIGEDSITAVFRQRHPFKPGDPIALRPAAGSVHLFDSDRGHRLKANRISP